MFRYMLPLWLSSHPVMKIWLPSHPVIEVEVNESKPKPNWLELPTDLTMNILQRLGTQEILMSARNVCPCWWNICKNPLMWQIIDMTDLSLSCNNVKYYGLLEEICDYAIGLSCGYVKELYIKKFGTDNLLFLINRREIHNLRCMRFEGCHRMSIGEFMEIVEKTRFLEELEIFHCFEINSGSFESIGKCCPLLRSLKYCPCFYTIKYEDEAFAIAKTMPRMCHLTILRNVLTHKGLLAILDGCPLLESLDLRGCFRVYLGGSLGERCKEQIKNLRLPSEFIEHRFNICDRKISTMF